MALRLIREIDPYTYFSGGNYGVNGAFLLGTDSGDFGGNNVFYDRLSMIIGYAQQGIFIKFMRFDPLFIDNTTSYYNVVDTPPVTAEGHATNAMAVGEWDRINSVQNFWMYNNQQIAGRSFRKVNPLDLQVTVGSSDPLPNVGTFQTRNGSLTATTVGYYTDNRSRPIFFESLNQIFMPWCAVRHTDNVTYTGVPAMIDMTTGAATIIQGLITEYTTTGAHKFNGPTLFGEIVDFKLPQFVPDDDSTPNFPKGLMYLFAQAVNGASGSISRRWVKAVDWNPLNQTGTPVRQHLRERLLSGYDFTENSPGTVGGVHNNFDHDTTPFYNPITREITYYSTDWTAAIGALAPGDIKYLYLSRSPVATTLSTVYPFSTIATGKTVSFGVDVSGSFGELISGESVDWQLRRASSIGEILATTPVAGETVTLQNTVDPTAAAASPITVYEDGVALTETTHYTLNRGSSQITFVAPKPLGGGAVYTADYRHLSDPQTPPHGQLLVTASLSDDNGRATTSVRYAEEVAVKDKWDRLDASL